MGMGKLSSSYKESRKKRVEANKKRLEDLNLIHLSQSLHKNLSPKPSPMKKVAKARTVEKQVVAVRRSARVANNPSPVYVEVEVLRVSLRSRSYGVAKGINSYRVATYEERQCTIEEAGKLAAKLDEEGFPTLVRPMLPSHVSGCFWLGLPSDFCRRALSGTDRTVMLVDEKGDEYPTVYFAHRKGLSGGWRGFAEVHGLADGDAVVFQVISHSVLKVYIIRVSDQEAGKEEDDAAVN